MKNTTNYKTQTRELHVRGTLWSGGKCNYVYSLNGQPLVTTMAGAKSIAGDFESLESAKIVVTDRQIRETVGQIKLS